MITTSNHDVTAKSHVCIEKLSIGDRLFLERSASGFSSSSSLSSLDNLSFNGFEGSKNPAGFLKIEQGLN